MSEAARADSAAVHLHLRGPIGPDGLTCLRQQLAASLHSWVHDIQVHADDQEDLDLGVLQALSGSHAYLAGTGGRLTLLGARPRVLSHIAIHNMAHLLPPAQHSRPGGDVDRSDSSSAHHGT